MNRVHEENALTLPDRPAPFLSILDQQTPSLKMVQVDTTHSKVRSTQQRRPKSHLNCGAPARNES